MVELILNHNFTCWGYFFFALSCSIVCNSSTKHQTYSLRIFFFLKKGIRNWSPYAYTYVDMMYICSRMKWNTRYIIYLFSIPVMYSMRAEMMSEILKVISQKWNECFPFIQKIEHYTVYIVNNRMNDDLFLWIYLQIHRCFLSNHVFIVNTSKCAWINTVEAHT